MHPDSSGVQAGASIRIVRETMTAHSFYPDEILHDILASTRNIAVIGATNSTGCPSWAVMNCLINKGYNVTPVNAGLAGQRILNRKVAATLADVPEPVDLIDIFRSSEVAGSIIEGALALPFPPKVIWMQPGVRNDTATAKATANGIRVVTDMCPKAVIERLFP